MIRFGLLLASLGLAASAAAADGPTCRTFDRSPPCCPHPPPQCCPAPVATPLDDELVAQVCGGKQSAKGQTTSLNVCKRYFQKGEAIGEVIFGREPGDAKAFDKLRADLGGPRAQVAVATVAGAAKAFVIREIDETGAPERASAWALVGAEIVHVQAERGVCDDGQVQRLLARAVERVTATATARR